MTNTEKKDTAAAFAEQEQGALPNKGSAKRSTRKVTNRRKGAGKAKDGRSNKKSRSSRKAPEPERGGKTTSRSGNKSATILALPAF
jgi:hypothetical protein